MAELSEEAKAELAEAVRILRDDGIHLHKTYRQRFLADPPDDRPEPGEGDPPPVKDKPESEVKPRKKGVGLWGASE